ncbi:hypothetical protein BCR33DRAFT_720328 [Rhizoclosmatium globosum]|uniref:G-protein coupled receptors family 2 profile 2 domain-containing protein n=1 Tax=Rhizoclosmatium globosum TaxID=329046 RepID=A0A1Y2BWC8_9FUNG|nr:hypothetical protein BCR33DRAFT_720328 [Rhizoclosmatium globosum]|eukprot:ORY39070.1 hypothetical protein BCR33DRAFT_720328 [Rhizoclosmatium globosum]
MTPDQLALIRLILRIISPLIVVLEKRLQRTINYLQAGLAIGEIIEAICWIITSEPALSSAGLTIILGATFHFIINLVSCYHVAITRAESFHLWLHFYCFGIASLLTGLVFMAEQLYARGPVWGDATFQTWISSAYPDLRIGLFYIPLWIQFTLMLITYILLIRVIKKTPDLPTESIVETGIVQGSSTDKELHRKHTVDYKDSTETVSHQPEHRLSRMVSKKTISTRKTVMTKSSRTAGVKEMKNHKKLILRTLVLAIGLIWSWTPATANRVISFLGGTSPYWLSLWIAVSISTSGFWNSGVFFVIWFWNRSNNRNSVTK